MQTIWSGLKKVGGLVSPAINFTKDAFVWQANFVDNHPWKAVALIWTLAIAAVVF